MDSLEPTTKTFGQKLWAFVEGALFQVGAGLVLMAVGALFSSKTIMMLALPVFILAAYRAKLFDHHERSKRVWLRIMIPCGIAVVLLIVWLAALKLKALTEESPTQRSSNQEAPTSAPPKNVPTETTGVQDSVRVEAHHAAPDTVKVEKHLGKKSTSGPIPAPKKTCSVNVATSGWRTNNPGKSPKAILDLTARLVGEYGDSNGGECPNNDWINGKLKNAGYWEVWANVNCEAYGIGIQVGTGAHAKFKQDVDVDKAPCDIALNIKDQGTQATFEGKVRVTVNDAETTVHIH